MFKAVIGLEIHIELNTKSKMFSPSSNIYSAIANTNVSEIDIAYPGTMPVVNEEGIKDAIKLASALNCTISDSLLFDRKNYYYPDLPKGFQITQMTKPLGKNGSLNILLNKEYKEILIHQLHVEEDAASFTHENDYSLIDYNRVGVPLIEVVTEPCINNAEEAIEFLETLRSVIKYLGISDADQSKGQIRCDVNVSLMRETDTELGVRAEVKNINSFSSVRETINYEIKRQTELLESGDYVLRETRRYSDADKKTYSMREKAEAIDYKYYVEPNIPEYKITKEFIDSLKKEIPVLPMDRLKKYMNDYNLTEVESRTLLKEKELSDFFENVVNMGVNPKEVSNWMTTRLVGYLNKNNVTVSNIYMTPKMLSNLINLINDKTISTEQGKKIFDLILEEKKEPLELIEKYDMKQVSDEGEIINIIKEVLDKNPDAVSTYKSGKTNILGFLVGLVLKSSGGKVNPSIASEILRKELEK